MAKNITMIFVFTFLTSVSRDMYQVVFNLFLREMEFSNLSIGNITSYTLWGSAIIGLIVSAFADKFGRKRILVVTTVLVPIISAIVVFQKNVNVIGILSFFRGGFLVVSMTVIVAIMVNSSPTNKRAKYFAINAALHMGSGVFGNFLGGLLADFMSFESSLIVSCVFYMLSVIPIFFVRESYTPHEVHDFDNNLKKIVVYSKEQKLILSLYFLTTITVGFGAGLFIHFGNLIFKDLFELSPTVIGLALSSAQLGTAIGNLLTHRLGKRFGPLEFSLFCHITVVPLIILMAIVREPFLFTALYAARFIFMNSVSPIFNSILNSYIPATKISTIAGFNSFLNNSIRAVAAIIFGQVVGSTLGYTFLFSLSALFYGFNVIIGIVLLAKFKNSKIVKELYV